MRYLFIITLFLFSIQVFSQPTGIIPTRDTLAQITSPKDIDSLFYWFAADQGVLDSLGGAIANNEGVDILTELGGRGHNVKKITNRPIWKASGGPGGYPYIVFSSTNTYLQEIDSTYWNSDAITFIIVVKVPSATGNIQEAYVGRDILANAKQWTFYGGNTAESYRNSFWCSANGTSVTLDAFTAKSAAWKLYSFVVDASSNASNLYTDGSDQTRNTNGTQTAIFNGYNKLYFGYQPQSVSEIIVYSRAITATERAALELYLNKKYDLYTPTPEYVNAHLDVDSDSLFYWFAADRDVTDSLGGTISNNEGVGNWGNLAPNAVPDVAQTTNTARPVWKATGGPNNKPCIQFDGSNDFLASAAHWWGSDDLTAIVVYAHYGSANSVERIFSKYVAPSDRQFYLTWVDGSPDYLEGGFSSSGSAYSGSRLWSDASTRNTTFVLHSFSGVTPNVSQHYRNGTSVTTTSGGTPPTTIYDSANYGLTIGALGSPAAGFGRINISEVMVFSKNLSDPIRKKYEYYLSQKYGITIQL